MTSSADEGEEQVDDEDDNIGDYWGDERDYEHLSSDSGCIIDEEYSQGGEGWMINDEHYSSGEEWVPGDDDEQQSVGSSAASEQERTGAGPSPHPASHRPTLYPSKRKEKYPEEIRLHARELKLLYHLIAKARRFRAMNRWKLAPYAFNYEGKPYKDRETREIDWTLHDEDGEFLGEVMRRRDWVERIEEALQVVEREGRDTIDRLRKATRIIRDLLRRDAPDGARQEHSPRGQERYFSR